MAPRLGTRTHLAGEWTSVRALCGSPATVASERSGGQRGVAVCAFAATRVTRDVSRNVTSEGHMRQTRQSSATRDRPSLPCGPISTSPRAFPGCARGALGCVTHDLAPARPRRAPATAMGGRGAESSPMSRPSKVRLPPRSKRSQSGRSMGRPEASQPSTPPSRNAASTPCSASLAESSFVWSPERQ